MDKVTFTMIAAIISLACQLTSAESDISSGYSHASMRAAKAKIGTVTPLVEEGTAAGKLYLFNNSVVVPGSPALLEFDIATKAFSVVKEFGQEYGMYDSVSAAVTCGDNYYAVYTQFPVAAGVLQVNVKTAKFNYLGTGFQTFIYHALHCGTNGELLGIASKPGQKELTMYLTSFDTATGNSTVIAPFPSMSRSFAGFVGYDGPLKFTPDGKEAYVAWTGAFPPRIREGELLIMDTDTGQITEKHAIPARYGLPYEIYPTGSASFRLAFLQGYGTDKETVNLCTATKPARSRLGAGWPSSSLKISSCTPVPGLDVGSAPMPICGDKIYTVGFPSVHPGDSQPLTEIELATGASSVVTDLAQVIPGTHIGAVACAQ